MIDRVFVDSNILIYAHDLDAGIRQQRGADCSIVAAAEQNQAVQLFSEDLNHGEVIAGITVVNPFLSAEKR